MHANLVEIQARTGDVRVTAAADHALALATRADARKEIAQIHRALGVLGSTGDTSVRAQHFAEALRRYQELGTRWEVGQTLRDWGRAEIKSADWTSRDRARKMLDGALTIFREMGDRRNAEDAQTLLG